MRSFPTDSAQRISPNIWNPISNGLHLYDPFLKTCSSDQQRFHCIGHAPLLLPQHSFFWLYTSTLLIYLYMIPKPSLVKPTIHQHELLIISIISIVLDRHHRCGNAQLCAGCRWQQRRRRRPVVDAHHFGLCDVWRRAADRVLVWGVVALARRHEDDLLEQETSVAMSGASGGVPHKTIYILNCPPIMMSLYECFLTAWMALPLQKCRIQTRGAVLLRTLSAACQESTTCPDVTSPKHAQRAGQSC